MKTIDIKEVANSLIGKVLCDIVTIKKPNGKVETIVGEDDEHAITDVMEWYFRGKSIWVCCDKIPCYDVLFSPSQLTRLAMGGEAISFSTFGDGSSEDGTVIKTRYYIKNK